MNPETKNKISKGLKTTEFWVVLLMSVLTAAMVVLQDHADTVLPVELSMKVLAVLGSVYVFCRTALKLVGLVAYFMKLDRDPLPVPLPPPGVSLPQVGMPLAPMAAAAAPIAPQPRQVAQSAGPAGTGSRLIPWSSLRGEEIAEEEAREAKEASLKEMLRQAGGPERPPLVYATAPPSANPGAL
jgi:hypothetical protein